MKLSTHHLLSALLLWPMVHSADFTPAPQSFRQELARHRELTNGLPAGPVQLIEADASGPRVFTAGGWREWRDGQWHEVPGLHVRGDDEFVFADHSGQPVRVALPWPKVIQVARHGATNYVALTDDLFTVVEGRLESLGWPSRFRVNQIAVAGDGRLLVASSAGLLTRQAGGYAPLSIRDGLGRAWAVEDVLGVAFDSAGLLWFASKAGVGRRAGDGWTFYEGKDGLPWNDFTGIAAGPGGEMWFGTKLGAIRWDGDEFHYRQGPRWLPHDEVRQIAVDAAGDAWFATANGVGQLTRQPMTLAEKAEFYEGEIERHIKRTPFGYVAEVSLPAAGDRSAVIQHDSDNDGLWTAMYGAGECFAHGATGDPRAKARARQAFEALRFLQKVTQGGTPAPPKGYVARTIRPAAWPDPNVGRLERDREEQQGDKLWKAYEPRWPKSADGQWFWKSDTSSDELDGHYFFYPLYFDLVADTAEEKDRVREVVRDLTDHLMAYGFTLTDIDGSPTRWGVFGPQFLNRDPHWWPERGLNSLSILSYLTVAAHVTGDAKYTDAARELVDRHGYAQNLMFPKVHFGPGSGNQSDDEMAVMCFYNLLRYSKDEALKAQARYACFAYWANESAELNPFFNFAYAAHGLGQSVTNVWGVYPLAPWPGWFEDSVATLRGFPLDRLGWPHRNSHRLDLVRLTPPQTSDLYEPASRPRGRRVNGKVLPVENRHFNHWNTDPWTLNYGGDGRELASGTVFLLPYYLGLYHGFIAKP